MKFSIAAASSFVAAAMAASLPSSFTLVAEGGSTVLTDGSNAFIGGNTSDKYQILTLKGGSENTQVSYTANGQTPTGWQNLYAVKGGNQPIALTVPHSGAVAQGGSTTGWEVNDEGYLTFNGKPTFGVHGKDGVQKVFFLGDGQGQFLQSRLYVKESK